MGMSQYTCWCQITACRNQLSPRTFWDPRHRTPRRAKIKINNITSHYHLAVAADKVENGSRVSLGIMSSLLSRPWSQQLTEPSLPPHPIPPPVTLCYVPSGCAALSRPGGGALGRLSGCGCGKIIKPVPFEP